VPSLIAIIDEFVTPTNPRRAADLRKLIYPAGEPDDGLGFGDSGEEG
jgi:hypothetical protein